MVEHCLASVVVFIDVGLVCSEVEVAVFADIGDAFTCLGVGFAFVLLEAERACSSESEVSLGTSYGLLVLSIAKTTIFILAVFEEGKAFAYGAIKFGKGEVGRLSCFECL